MGVSPKMFALDNLTSFRATWEKLGFNASEETALMGAHTFGKLNVCVGGLNGAMRGFSCNDPEKMLPKLNESNLYPNCKPEATNNSGTIVAKRNACWAKGQRKSKAGCKGMPCTYAPELHPVYPLYGRYYEKDKKKLKDNKYKMLASDNDETADIALGEGFGDGGIWDQTPEKFDNNYFKLLQGEDISQKDTCCGPTGSYKSRKFNVKGKVCLEVGDERKCLKQAKKIKNKTQK